MTPAMLIELLGSLRGRLRAWSAVYGVGLVVAVAVGTFLAIGLFDYVIHLSKVWRLLLALSALGGAGWLIARHVVCPITSSLPIGDIAGRIERRFPQFDDRLRSAVDFIERPTPDSPTMQRSTIDQAINLASALPIREVLDPRPALRAAGIGFGAVVVMLIFVATLDGATRSILFSRVLNPLGNAVWPRRVQIALEPIAARVPSGGQVQVKLRLTRGDSAKMRPIVFFEDAAGNRRQEYLTRGDDGTYGASIDAQSDSPEKPGAMKVWVIAGDDRTTDAAVQVLPKLGVESLTATLASPPYAAHNASPVFADLANQQASGLVGSTVKLSLRFTKPVPDAASIRLVPIDEAAAPTTSWTSTGARQFEAGLRLNQTVRFRVEATDADGFSVSGSSEFQLVARPDAPPSISIENPRRAEERTAESVVPLVGTAEDDAGIRDLQLVVSKLGESPREWTIPLIVDGIAAASDAPLAWTALDAGGDRKRFRVDYAWTLAALPDARLKPGDILEYALRVTDNFDLDGQRHAAVDSSKLRITIISQEQLANRAMDELRQVKAQVEQVKSQHDRTTAETDALGTDVREKSKLDAADASVATRLQQQIGSTASATRSTAERLADLRRAMDENRSTSSDLAQLSKDVGERLASTAEGSMKESLQSLGRATDASRADRKEAIDRSVESQRQASGELAAAVKRLEDVGSLNASIGEVQKMLDDQRKLTEASRELAAGNAGKTPQQMSADDRERLAKQVAEQAALANRSQKAMDRLGKAADQLQKSDPDGAAAMRAAQKQGQSKSVTPSQQQAAKQMEQNQQKNARQSQQQAEAGLETMLSELKAAQTRKLSELQKKLADLQAQIAILVRRQSGHNLDNLTLQGPAAMDQRKDAVAKLTALSERKPTEPPATMPRLLSGQGQTERNTRDIAKKAADVPDGAEPASRLTRAATLMERAAVYVKDAKLPEAYEPPQLDALATLDDAQRMIDAQKQKVDDEVEGEQQEAIRNAFVRIRDEQQKLADETKRLEGARGAEGKLNRVDAVRLGQLPGEQQKLHDDVAKVGENLVALKSVVYLWANKQIADQMGDEKAELAASRTGNVAQRTHAQILADLSAMIDNLMVSPKESRFESPSAAGGEGGGKSSKPMPPEAELRLIKALQTNINVATKRLCDDVGGAEPLTEAQNASAVSLGRRQGQVRTLLGELLSGAGNGESPLGPPAVESVATDEEQQLQQIDAREVEQELLGGKPGGEMAEVDLRRTGDRMARVNQRLEQTRDAGAVTQVVEKRILGDFDLLIQAARQQQQKPPSGGQQKPSGQQQPAPKPGEQQAQNKGENKPGNASAAAAASNAGGQTGVASASGKSIDERSEEWGNISPRLRQPVLDSRDETIVERYRRLIQDYTQAVSTEASGGSSATPSTGGR